MGPVQDGVRTGAQVEKGGVEMRAMMGKGLGWESTSQV
jgi:hypothetical protein